MNREERFILGKKLMLAEEKGISHVVQELGNEVLQEVLRLEQCGEPEEAKAFEAFMPVDLDFLSSLAPILGEEELEKTLVLYVEEKNRLRLQYLASIRQQHIQL